MYALDKTENPEVEINISDSEGRVFIYISDNGNGIEPGKMDKIFLPFYSTREDGSGIGLSFSKQVLHLHHGRIRVTSIPGKETTFTLDLPKDVPFINQ